jgi:hypothetical protein
MTATRQYVAQNHSWSLDELELRAELLKDTTAAETASADSFLVNGLTLEGANWRKDDLLVLDDHTGGGKLSIPLPGVVFTWIKAQMRTRGGTSSAD